LDFEWVTWGLISRDQCRDGTVIMIKRTCGPIYALVIASLMVPTVALALMGDRKPSSNNNGGLFTEILKPQGWLSFQKSR